MSDEMKRATGADLADALVRAATRLYCGIERTPEEHVQYTHEFVRARTAVVAAIDRPPLPPQDPADAADRLGRRMGV